MDPNEMDPSDPTGGDNADAPSAGPGQSNVRYRIFVLLALLVAGAAFAAAVWRTQTDDEPPVSVSGRPDIVEFVIPRDGASIQRQTEIGIDLAPGYEARLVIYGQEIPEDELRLVPEQNQVFFSAGEGKTIEELRAGRNCVTAIAWLSQDGRGTRDQSITWCFGVT